MTDRETLPWIIEYETFPFRAIYTAFAAPYYDSERLHREFDIKYPRSTIRSMRRMFAEERTEGLPQLFT